MPSQFDEFMHEHRRIEEWLRERAESGRHRSFIELAQDQAKRHPLIQRHFRRLADLTELRNLLAHKAGHRGEPIAQPSASVVEELRRLADHLTAPAPLPKRVRHPVEVFDSERPLADALKLMRRRAYSQVPVSVHGRVNALLTSNTIMRWLAANIDAELVDVVETSIRAVLDAAERTEHWDFCAVSADSAEVLDRFITSQETGLPLEALLLTDSGSEQRELRGIVTVSDLGELAKRLVSGRK